MSAPPRIEQVARLRARFGDRCWLCHEQMQFDANPNSSMAPSIEHLLALSLGGPRTEHNLVLCHTKCNRILGCRPLTDKIKLRERRRRRLWKKSISI